VPSPLFVADEATLKAALRFSGVVDGSNADAMFDQAVVAVRSGFYRTLGVARVAVLLAIPYTDSPTTETSLLRTVATTTEIEWVRYELMRTLPVLFQDASGDALDVWNREAPFRGMGKTSLDKAREALWEMILQNLDMIAGNEEVGEHGGVQGGDIAPTTTPPRPFQSIFPEGLTSLADGGY